MEIPPSNTTISSENSDAGKKKGRKEKREEEENSIRGLMFGVVKSDFIVSLNLLAELFPDTPRTLLALELDGMIVNESVEERRDR